MARTTRPSCACRPRRWRKRGRGAVDRPIPAGRFRGGARLALTGSPSHLQTRMQFRALGVPRSWPAPSTPRTSLRRWKKMGGKAGSARSNDRPDRLRQVLVRVLGHRLEPDRAHGGDTHEAPAGAAGDGPAVRAPGTWPCRIPTWPGGTRRGPLRLLAAHATAIRAAASDGNRRRGRPALGAGRGGPAGVGLRLDPQRAGGTRGPRCWPHVFGGRPPRSGSLSTTGSNRRARFAASTQLHPSGRRGNADSRVQAGLHFRFSCGPGRRWGDRWARGRWPPRCGRCGDGQSR
jgi:hypothetical protein